VETAEQFWGGWSCLSPVHSTTIARLTVNRDE